MLLQNYRPCGVSQALLCPGTSAEGLVRLQSPLQTQRGLDRLMGRGPCSTGPGELQATRLLILRQCACCTQHTVHTPPTQCTPCTQHICAYNAWGICTYVLYIWVYMYIHPMQTPCTQCVYTTYHPLPHTSGIHMHTCQAHTTHNHTRYIHHMSHTESDDVHPPHTCAHNTHHHYVLYLNYTSHTYVQTMHATHYVRFHAHTSCTQHKP